MGYLYLYIYIFAVTSVHAGRSAMAAVVGMTVQQQIQSYLKKLEELRSHLTTGREKRKCSNYVVSFEITEFLQTANFVLLKLNDVFCRINTTLYRYCHFCMTTTGKTTMSAM